MMEAETLLPSSATGSIVQGSTRVPRVFFMHIAKTAGSYLNEALEKSLPPGQVACHIEHHLGNTADLQVLADRGVRVMTGHVMYGLWTEVAAPLDEPYLKVTILRDPIAHLASHLLWLDHYGLADFEGEYARLDSDHRGVVDRIRRVDLNDIGQLDRYLTGLNPTEIRLFDNCQSRYFLTRGRRDPNSVRPLSLADARNLRTKASEFDVILRQDRLETGLSQLSHTLGVELVGNDVRVNASRSDRKIDITNPLVRQVLTKRTLLDQWLWRWQKDA